MAFGCTVESTTTVSSAFFEMTFRFTATEMVRDSKCSTPCFPILSSAFQSQTIDLVLNRLAIRHNHFERRLINRQQPVFEHGGVVLR